MDINESYFLGLVLDLAASIETNRVELRKYIDKLEKSREDEKRRLDKLEKSREEEKRHIDEEKWRLEEEKCRLDEEKRHIDEEKRRLDKLEDRREEEKRRLDEEKQNTERQKIESSDVWMKDLEEKVVEIPEDLDRLQAFLQQELRTKIPCTHRILKRIAERDKTEQCVEVCGKLFEPVDGDLSSDTHAVVYKVLNPVMSESEGATEDTYHSLWDVLIAHVLMKVSHGCFLRNSNRSTSTRLCRPDFCFYYKKLNICVFRGEEKAYGEMKVPLAELQEKLDTWIYDDAPYLLGYAAVGKQVTLARIQKGARGRAVVQRVEDYDLDSLASRLEFFLAILNSFSATCEQNKETFRFP